MPTVSRRPASSKNRYARFRAELRGEVEADKPKKEPKTAADFRRQRMEQYYDKKKLNRPFARTLLGRSHTGQGDQEERR